MTATHGWWCNSSTYPTRCKYCGGQVFYFSCDCGSKVFFDDLGPPWPEHRCFEYLSAQYGRDFIANGMAIMMMTPGVEIGHRIDADYISEVQEQVKNPVPPDILRQDPYDGVKTVEDGIVREIYLEVDLFKRLNIPRTSIGVSLLGFLGKEKYGQVTIHTGGLGEEGRDSFTFLVKTKMLKRKSVIKGDYIICHLRGITIADQATVWICDKLGGVFD